MKIELIDKNYAIERFTGIIDGWINVKSNTTAVDVIQSLHTFETREYAHWEWNGFDDIGWVCSSCNWEVSRDSRPWFKYCPNCGAVMSKRAAIIEL